MGSPLVTTVIPAYNCEKYVGKAIDSILAQTYRPVEIIVVDDGSTDGTHDVLSGFGAKVRVLERENGGPSAARNAGIAAASGGLIAFLDADDLWKPNKLSLQVPLFEDKEVGLVYSNFDYINEKGNLIRTRLGRWHRGNIFRAIMKYGIVWTGTVVARKSVLHQTGGFDESMPVCEDWDMWLRISASCKVDYDIRTLASYRMRKDSLLGGVEFIKWMFHTLKKNSALSAKQAGMSGREYGRILAHYYYRLGNGKLPDLIDKRNREYLWRAIRANPFHFKALRAYFWGLCAYWRGRKSEAIGLEYLNR